MPGQRSNKLSNEYTFNCLGNALIPKEKPAAPEYAAGLFLFVS